MKKEILTDELSLGMQTELVKQASDEQPNLVKAAECLHAALEILEEQGLQTRADQVLQVLDKIGQRAEPIKKSAKIHSLKQLMEAGVSQRDLKEFAGGNPRAIAKLNLVLRKLGLSEHELSKFLGPGNVMSEEEAHKALSPNEPMGPFRHHQEPEESGEIEFKSLAKKKVKSPGRPDRISDRHTKGLTPEKQIANLKHHGTPFNMANDGNFTSTFDIDASDDELMGIEIQEDSLEVFDKEIPLEDFEDERD